MDFTIEKLSQQIKKQELSPVDLTKQCLDAIEKQSKVNAFITVMKEEALEAAKIAESEIAAGRYLGPLHGIPVAIKDFYDTKGIKTTAAFKHFENRIPEKDAAIVTKLKKSGTIIIGKTNMHQLGMGTTSLNSHYGAVENPWNSDFIPGGSSGGSAAAIAAKMCLASLDTDVVGSCRIPASCCGVVAFKATFGQLDNSGILEGEPVDDIILKLSHVGITTRSIEDCKLVYRELIAEKEPTDQQPAVESMAVVSNFEASSEVTSLFNDVINSLSEKFSLNPISLPFQKAKFSTDAIDQDRASIAADLFKRDELVVLPTLTENVLTVKEAKKRGDQAVNPANTFFANYFGLPAVTIPVSKDSSGLPFGLQLIGMPGAEETLLNAARTIETMVQWEHLH